MIMKDIRKVNDNKRNRYNRKKLIVDSLVMLPYMGIFPLPLPH